MVIKQFTLQLDEKHFPLPLCVEWLDGKKWKLLSPFSYHRDSSEVITAPEGYITDFGSKPKITWFWVGSPTDEAGPAYIIHDWCCDHATWPISKTDHIFLEAMKVLKVNWFKRTIMYLAVRAFHRFR